MDASTGDDLVGMANAVLQPGFVGKEPPPWVRRRLAEGLGGVVLFARNVVDRDQVAELTAALRAERPDIIVAIDEEAGDVTRIDAHNGSPWPGNLALGAVDDAALTREVACHIGRDLASVGITFDYAPDADVNSDPNNPVIGSRAFGAEPERVARHTAAWIPGCRRPASPPAPSTSRARQHQRRLAPGRPDHQGRPGRARRGRAGAVPRRHRRRRAGGDERATCASPPSTRTCRPPSAGGSSPACCATSWASTGLIVTDGIEMRAISDRYGLANATRPGPGRRRRRDLRRRRARRRGHRRTCSATPSSPPCAPASCPRSGSPTPPRGCAALAAWSTAARTPAGAAGPEGRRAGAVRGPPGAAHHRAGRHVPARRPGVRDRVPAGAQLRDRAGDAVGPPRAARRAGARHVRRAAVSEEGLPDALQSSLGRPLLLVVRDPHRYPWITDALRRLARGAAGRGRGRDGCPRRASGRPAHRHLRRDGRLRPGGRRTARRPVTSRLRTVTARLLFRRSV